MESGEWRVESGWWAVGLWLRGGGLGGWIEAEGVPVCVKGGLWWGWALAGIGLLWDQAGVDGGAVSA